MWSSKIQSVKQESRDFSHVRFKFDSNKRLFYTLELKTTKGDLFSFEDINIKEKQTKQNDPQTSNIGT